CAGLSLSLTTPNRVSGCAGLSLSLTTPNRVSGCALNSADPLENLGQFGGEGALRFLFALSGTAAAFHRPVAGGGVGSLCWWSTLFRSGGAYGTRAFNHGSR